MDQKSFRDLGVSHESRRQERSAARYYLDFVDDTGYLIGKSWPKNVRHQLGGYIRQPNDYVLDRLANSLSDRTATPEESEVQMILGSTSSFANNLPYSFTMALAYARAIDEVKKETIGPKASPASENSLMTKILGDTMWKAEDITEESLQQIDILIDLITQIEGFSYHWYLPKITQLRRAVEEKMKVERFVPSVEESEASIEELIEANDELFSNMLMLQKYGLKPCIAPALPTSGSVREWLVIPTDLGFRSIQPHHPYSRLLGSFLGSSKPILTSTTENIEYVGDSQGESKAGVIAKAVPGVGPESNITLIGLGKDGHLYSISGQRWLDYLSDTLRRQYEQVRSEIISIYYDAVVPVYITELVREDLSEPPFLKLGRLSIGKKKNKPDFRRLILARKRILEEKRDEIENELENPKADLVEAKQKKEIAKHEVIGHVRALPSNFRASPLARELCLEDLGIELAEYGETYVKPHERGSLEEEEKGHKVSFTVGKMATKMAGRRSKNRKKKKKK